MMIRPRHLLLSTLLALPLCCLSVHAQEASTPGLQQRMTSDEFKAAGLDKLSPQELQSLDQWLSAHPKVTTKMVTATGKPVFYAPKTERSKIDAHIVGHFDGWGGSTEFKLDNGQVWRQADSGSTSCPARENPWVKIKPMMMGNWLMYVQDCNESIHVQREK
jgi:hypothetical protein